MGLKMSQLPKELHSLTRVYQRELDMYLKAHRPAINKALKLGGTTSNIEQVLNYTLNKVAQGASYVAPAADESDAEDFSDAAKKAFKAGCEGCANQTVKVLQVAIAKDPNLKGKWICHRFMVGGLLVFEHHAVCLQLKKGSPMDGYIYDPWITQSPQVYTAKNWKSRFNIRSVIGAPRSEWY
ncbi:MAG: hypothetical protein HKN21_06935 [Candidatus Eisenbacteria bacterium]|uniref:Uncharacterized protein n=1 Tax=Eiseniibacteriota bacterium TaxID=2212470 RepID=A0A7Y2EEF0_UNCEI|nr:hypothetical protein [Candidatus Eisenbacteria bacterium]